MDEDLPPVMAAENPEVGQNTPTNSPFTKASIKAKFKAIRWSTLRKSKRKRPAVLQEVSMTFICLQCKLDISSVHSITQTIVESEKVVHIRLSMSELTQVKSYQ